jgi:hypothetical protein
MRRVLVPAVLLLLLTVRPCEANVLCRWTGICLYLSRGFEITVVDAANDSPLAGVFAWAEWIQYAAHGTNGPLVVQEATSGTDGRLAFPAWGPRRGSAAGLDLGADPGLLLFKPGYAPLVAQNEVPLGADHRAMARTFTRTGAALRLQPWAGPVAERVRQLQSLALAPYVGRFTDEQGIQFRITYLKRLDLVEAELAKLPPGDVEVARFRASLELDRRFWSGGRR